MNLITLSGYLGRELTYHDSINSIAESSKSTQCNSLFLCNAVVVEEAQPFDVASPWLVPSLADRPSVS